MIPSSLAFARFTFPSWCEMSMTTLSGLDMFPSVRQSLGGVRMAVHQLIGRRSVLFSGAWRLGRMHEFPSRRSCTGVTCYTSHDPWVWGERDEAARLHGTAQRRGGRVAA